jgi:hypothetical protein
MTPIERAVDWTCGVRRGEGLTPASLRAAADIARGYGGPEWEETADRLLAKASDLEQETHP